MLVHYGDTGIYSPTAERPFPFTVRELARLSVQRSLVHEQHLAQRYAREYFRSTMLPTSEPGLDTSRNPQPVKLSDEAAGMLGRLDRAQSNNCYGCRMEQQWGHPVVYGLHARNCPKRNG